MDCCISSNVQLMVIKKCEMEKRKIICGFGPCFASKKNQSLINHCTRFAVVYPHAIVAKGPNDPNSVLKRCTPLYFPHRATAADAADCCEFPTSSSPAAPLKSLGTINFNPLIAYARTRTSSSVPSSRSIPFCNHVGRPESGFVISDRFSPDFISGAGMWPT